MKASRFSQYGLPSVLLLEERETPEPGPGEPLVQVLAAAINPSDVKNVAGAFRSSLPRTPGRDYAGAVVAGDGKNREVRGSEPAFGVKRDGSHAQFVILPTEWLADKPGCLSMEQAGSICVPFLVAWMGLIDGARVQSGETVLATGRKPISRRSCRGSSMSTSGLTRATRLSRSRRKNSQGCRNVPVRRMTGNGFCCTQFRSFARISFRTRLSVAGVSPKPIPPSTDTVAPFQSATAKN